MHLHRYWLFATAMISFFASFVQGDPPQWQPKPRAILDKIDYNYNNWRIAFSHDGKMLASGGRPMMLKLWNSETGKLVSDFSDAEDPKIPSIYAIAFSPDDSCLAVGTFLEGTSVQLWDVPGDPAKRKPSVELRRQGGGVNGIAFSPDGRKLACACGDGHVGVWDAKKRIPLRLLNGHGTWASAGLFTPDGKTLVTAGENDVIQLWDIDSWKVQKTLKFPGGNVGKIAVSKNGKILAAASSGYGRVIVWNLGDLRTGLDLREQDNPHICLTPDGKYLLIGGGDRIEVWDVANARRHRQCKTHYTFPLATAISPDGKTLAAGLDDGRILLWDVNALLGDEKGAAEGK